MTPIYSTNQTHTLHHNFYYPKNKKEVKATLLIVHGMAEHSGRYAEFAEYLATQGIAVLTYDHLGHGKTAKSSEEFGFFDKKFPMQTLLQDTVLMADILKSKYPNVSHFIMGHSMGSFIVRNVLKYHSHDFTGAILMGTADKDRLVEFLLPVFKLLNNFKPFQASSFGANTVNKILNSKLKDNQIKSKFAWVSANEDNITAYENDPLCGFDFTNNGYFGLLSLIKQGVNTPFYNNIATDFPMMIISGKDDPVGNMGKGIDNLANDLTKHGFNNIQKTLYPNMRHELLGELDKQVVFNDISQWILNK
ncbi:MAG: lysophospholipase [Moraxellaceae bacterium]|nr:lysophospholipase [Moraxellaceae bacterium]